MENSVALAGRFEEEGADTIVWLAVATEARTVSGRLFLEREEHTTHLLNATLETPQEREALLTLLREFWGGSSPSPASALVVIG